MSASSVLSTAKKSVLDSGPRSSHFRTEIERQKADFLRLFESGNWSDLTLVAEGRHFHVHSAILKARLGSAFGSCPVSSQLTLCDIKSSDTEQTLRDIYSSDFVSNADVLNELARLSLPQSDYEKLSKPIGATRTLNQCLSILFESKELSDLTIIVEDKSIKAHKAVLACQCFYFSAMLSGSWIESSSKEITLKGVTHSSVQLALRYIYCCAVDWSPEMKISDLFIVATMYGLEGMMEDICFLLQEKYCCKFHRPCKNCTENVPLCLKLSSDFPLDKLKENCLNWLCKYFDRIWCTKAFASLPVDLHQLVLETKKSSLSYGNVIGVLRGCDCLGGAMSSYCKWAEPVQELNQKLLKYCVHFVSCNLYNIVHSRAFRDLFEGIGSSSTLVNLIFQKLLSDMSAENCCLNLRCSSVLMDNGFADDIQALVTDFHLSCKKFALCHLAQVRRMALWKTLPKLLCDELEAAAVTSFVQFGPAKNVKPKSRAAPKRFNSKKKS